LATHHGVVAVQWTQSNATAGSRFALSVTVPVSTRAELCVPTLELDAWSESVTIIESPTTGSNISAPRAAWRNGGFLGVVGCSGAAATPGAICFSCGCGSYDLQLG
jgi:hypothetical protein